jgi:transposase-like protein
MMDLIDKEEAPFRWLPTHTGVKMEYFEDFMKNANTITNLSSRGSYGLTATAEEQLTH